ncbi:ESX secretion-associated protein EspG [Mycobacterium sp. 1274761.0]|uniref:ESX secretion-associated protein EspG n=1 Tax=Mycobacterium sp. 1274761.0 TaxID=1834077 RepID=UPI0007FC2362|nr:ESX secretion-associated protein EspG [Mycobacterium sp. 1274761.0]OBK71953.1 secretion protein EspG [Mycobacterium sp. 1274761.0]
MRPNAVELTVERAWRIADSLGAGSFPWVLAITPLTPGSGDHIQVVAEPVVEEWIRLACHPAQWLELRFVTAGGDLLRGLIARRGDRTVVALRNAHLVTFTEMDIGDPHALVPIVTAGLSGRAPARFDEFMLPAQVGARADERIRNGTPVDEVLEFLGIPPSARPVVASVFEDRRTYVEIVAGQRRDGHHVATDVGVGIIDSSQGRVVVSPTRAPDGEWISTFSPGTPFAIATAVDRLIAALPDGSWFPDLQLTRDFDHTTEHQREHQKTACPTTL